jgi:dihydrofolate synthase/folylpolyglutamate synthase
MPVAGHTEGLSLESMVELMAALGDPHRSFKSIHITGTNGKGSTARIIAELLRHSGLSVGLYTSPNLERINERIVWDGRNIPDDEFARVVGLLSEIEPLLATTPSRFELLTAAAFMWFAEQAVDVVVVEVGLLGRFDATNVVESEVAVITNIGKDHTMGGEGWRTEVAAEKAGIIKPGSHVVLGSAMGDLLPVFTAEPSAALWHRDSEFDVERNEVAVGGRIIDLRTPHGQYLDLFVPFHGAHQGDNAATAVVAVEALVGGSLDRELVDQALATVELPVRFEVVAANPLVILDGAHNRPGAEAAATTLFDGFARTGSWILVVGLLVGRDPIELLEGFRADQFDAVICTQADSSRAIPVHELMDAAESLGVTAQAVPSSVEALSRAVAVSSEDDLILVTGSLYLVAEIRTALLAAQESTPPA